MSGTTWTDHECRLRPAHDRSCRRQRSTRHPSCRDASEAVAVVRFAFHAWTDGEMCFVYCLMRDLGHNVLGVAKVRHKMIGEREAVTRREARARAISISLFKTCLGGINGDAGKTL